MDVVGTITYTKQRQVGVGEGMNSQVFIATDPQLSGEIVVKEVLKTKLGNDPARFFQEAGAMFANEHDNVVPVRYACQTPDMIGLAMRYFPRGSLAPRIATNPLPLREVVRIGVEVMQGLMHIHSAGYIHFDLKPSNVLFSDNDRPMVADFGQARKFDPTTGTVKVPPLYRPAIPPEVWTTGNGTILCDIYQSGLLLYRMANSSAIFKAQRPADKNVLKAATIVGRFPDRKSFLPHVPPRMRTVIRKALQKLPENRFDNAMQLADALGRIPIPLDWTTETAPNGNITWRAARPGQPDLVVLLEQDASGWNTKVYTERPPAARRALGRAVYWRAGIQRADALKVLDDVFRTLDGGG